MCKIKDVLRLKLDTKLSHQQIAAALAVSKGVARLCAPLRHLDSASAALSRAARQPRQHHAPGRWRRVGLRLGQAEQAGAGLLNALGNVHACCAPGGPAW